MRGCGCLVTALVGLFLLLADDEAVLAWAQLYARIAYLAEQLTGVGGRFALKQLRKLAAERRGNPRP
jgi:hydroxyethylthiazole kinase-like sugar kinase family protein